MKTRFTSVFAKAATLLFVMLLTTVSAWADDSGSCGTNVTYSYVESTHTLTISGNGAMADYNSSSDRPWHSYSGNITSVVIEGGVTTIGKYAFKNCNNLSTATISASVQSIGEDAFYRCTGLSTVSFAANSQLESIGINAFIQCNNAGFTSIEIPASVTHIDNSAFLACSNLATVTFAAGSQLATIGEQAFYNTAIASITIPASVTSIGSNVFGDCQNLTSINVDANNTNYASEGGVLFNKAKTTLLLYPRGNTATSYTIPASVETIGENAFKENGKLTSVTIPNSVGTIGSEAFSGCTKLATVTIPNSVQTIGNNAFDSCTGLTSITIPASVTSIGNNAFENCTNLATVTVYAPSCTLGTDAFENCPLTNIYVFEDKVTYYQNAANWSTYASKISEIPNSGNCGATGHDSDVKYVLTGTSTNYTLTIMKVGTTGAMADYANSNSQPWKDYRSNITSVVIESGVTHIGNNAFTDCSNLATVTFAAGSQLTSIGDLAFYYCNNSLNTITIPASVQTIGSNAFNSCSNLATVTFATGSQLTTIENSAFDQCGALTAFTVPSGVTSIGDGAFSGCSSLATINVEAGNIYYSSEGGVLFNYDKTILIQYPIGNSRTAYTIPGGVRTIGSHAFYFNKNLTSVTIATSVQTICDNAFYGCPYLATVAFAPCSQLESIGVNAFRYCTFLTSVTIPASVTSIRERAFDSCYLLTSVTIYAPWLTTYGLNAFDSNGSDRKIYVISDRVSTYKGSWSAYESDIEDIPALAVNDAGGTLGKWTTYYNGLADVQVADGTTIYKATYDKSANNVTLTPVSSNIIKMGEAVLLKSENDIVLSSAVGGGTGDYDGNDLHGVDYATPLADLGSSTDTYYVLGNKNGHFGFHKYTGTNMPANKAFLRISGDGNALAPSIDMYIDNNATGIENVQSSKLNVQCDNAWYTLDGRKLNAQPTQKGLYIVNGKKAVIK